MKAAVLHQLGQAPKYDDYPDPVPQNDKQVIINVKAAAVKNLDKSRASGVHYASHKNLPEVVGIDGVGTLADGTRVYATGITGMIAEKAIADKSKCINLPDHIDDIQAAALPNAIIGAALALKYRAKKKQGDVILINGATGVTGQAAIQIAKHYGAKHIITTGRNPETLKKLPELGADEVVSLLQQDEQLLNQLKEINKNKPVDIVLDYTWGHPVELIITALKGGGLHAVPHSVRIVTVGSMAGEAMTLMSGSLRSSPIEILGSGFGSLSHEAMQKMNTEILPEMFALAATGKLKVETETAELKDIEAAWNKKIDAGKRLVITM